MLMFWYRLLNGKSSKLSNIMYRFEFSIFLKGNNQMSWIFKVKNILDNLGLSDLWKNQAIDLTQLTFKSIVNQKLQDISEQEWHSDVELNQQCTIYRIFKQKLCFEKYLITLNENTRRIFCSFRCLNHKLPIVTGRYSHIPRSERLCTYCSSNDIGDEFHYLFLCPFFENKRKQHQELLLEVS